MIHRHIAALSCLVVLTFESCVSPPTPEEAREARNRTAKIVYRGLEGESRFAPLERFAKEHAGTPAAEEASARAKTLRENARLELAWEDTVAKNTVSGYQSYVTQFPAGPMVGRAGDIIRKRVESAVTLLQVRIHSDREPFQGAITFSGGDSLAQLSTGTAEKPLKLNLSGSSNSSKGPQPGHVYVHLKLTLKSKESFTTWIQLSDGESTVTKPHGKHKAFGSKDIVWMSANTDQLIAFTGGQVVEQERLWVVPTSSLKRGKISFGGVSYRLADYLRKQPR